jgi:hypothetical protein
MFDSSMCIDIACKVSCKEKRRRWQRSDEVTALQQLVGSKLLGFADVRAHCLAML